MGGQGFVALEECWKASRKAIAEILGRQMGVRVASHLAACEAQGQKDRRNGFYPRRLLTEIGTLELRVPRTRRDAPVEVIRACAR